MNIPLTEEQAEEIVLFLLKRDLKNCQEDLLMWLSMGVCKSVLTSIKQVQKDIKMLKKAVNFYSVNPPYPDVK